MISGSTRITVIAHCGVFHLPLHELSLCGLHSSPLSVLGDDDLAIFAGDGDIIPYVKTRFLKLHSLQHDRRRFFVLITALSVNLNTSLLCVLDTVVVFQIHIDPDFRIRFSVAQEAHGLDMARGKEATNSYLRQ